MLSVSPSVVSTLAATDDDDSPMRRRREGPSSSSSSDDDDDYDAYEAMIAGENAPVQLPLVEVQRPHHDPSHSAPSGIVLEGDSEDDDDDDNDTDAAHDDGALDLDGISHDGSSSASSSISSHIAINSASASSRFSNYSSDFDAFDALLPESDVEHLIQDKMASGNVVVEPVLSARHAHIPRKRCTISYPNLSIYLSIVIYLS